MSSITPPADANMGPRDPPLMSADAATARVHSQHQGIFMLVHEYVAGLRLGLSEGRLLAIFDVVIGRVETNCVVEEELLLDRFSVGRSAHIAEHRRLLDSLQAARRMLPGWLIEGPRIEAEQIFDELIVHHLRYDADFLRMDAESR